MSRMSRWWASPYAPAVAAALLGLLALVETGARLSDATTPADPAADVSEDARPFLVTLALLSTLPLALLSTLPLVVLSAHVASAAVLVTTASVLSLTLFHNLTLAGVAAQAMVLYHCGHRVSPVLALAPLPIYAGYVMASAPDDGSGERVVAVLAVMCSSAAAAAGIARRGRTETRVYSAAAQAVADSLHEHAARGERARIARELHDVVAHHISMISVQAETARLTTSGLPPEGAKRLLAIGDTARAALTEMRRLLGVLREDAGTGPGRRPQPALQQLIELVDDVRDTAGAATRLIVRGRVVPLDPGIELTAYRIVQEALTNARRHAPGAAVDVELAYGDRELRVRIRDNGPGPRTAGRARTAADLSQARSPEPDTLGVPAATGHGLVGMRERAAMVGGELSAGAAPGGGFAVEARLPVPVEEAV